MGNTNKVLIWVLIVLAWTAILVGLQPDATSDIEQRMDTVRCEQWGGRFADPCQDV